MSTIYKIYMSALKKVEGGDEREGVDSIKSDRF